MDHAGEIMELSGREGYFPHQLVPTGQRNSVGFWEMFVDDEGKAKRDRYSVHLFVKVVGLTDDRCPGRNWIGDHSVEGL